MNDDNLQFQVSGAIGKQNGQLYPIVRLEIPGYLPEFFMPLGKAVDLGTSLVHAAIRSQSDLLIVQALMKRGYDRNECQAFLDEMKVLNDE